MGKKRIVLENHADTALLARHKLVVATHNAAIDLNFTWLIACNPQPPATVWSCRNRWDLIAQGAIPLAESQTQALRLAGLIIAMNLHKLERVCHQLCCPMNGLNKSAAP